MNHSSPRQSRGKQRKSYRVGEEYSFLDEDEDGSVPSGTQTPAFQDDDDDDDDGDAFMPDAQDGELEYDEDEVIAEEDEDVSEEEEDDGSDSDDSTGPPRRNVRGLKAVRAAPTTPAVRRAKKLTDNIPSPVTFAKGSGVKVRPVDADAQLRTRGIPDFDKIGGHEPRLKNLFGPDAAHLKPVLASRDYWFPQETFPIRSFAKVSSDDAEVGSLRRSFFEVSGARERESEALRTWYTDAGKSAFATAQRTKMLTKDEAEEHMKTPGPESVNVLAGPVNTPQVNTLVKGSYMNIAKPFPASQDRRGWLFNLGSWIQDAQWASNEDSNIQYLAVAVEQRPTSGDQPKPMEQPKAPAFNPTEPFPACVQQVADTYILTISSGWPSNPQFLSISTADGFARLIDIRSPTADTVVSIRGRTLCLAQAWHEHTQSFVMPDEHYILRHTPLRRYYHNLYSMRLENSITRVATSPVHPGVLVGGTDGDVQTSNPIMRITNYKIMPWQQKWFVHEWRGPMERMLVKPTDGHAATAEEGPVEQSINNATPESQAGASAHVPEKVPQEILSQPLVRITEGYKAGQTGIAHTSAATKRGNPEVGRSISIFEEQTAITALAWNPNLKFGTWAVAGMGSGLMRVEDVGI
ncbi:hypothetical protein ACET3X_000259 [Alternaria dauci]|uniref:Transcription factor n=1 Tax=Alternaria dauci TaxID=48095 RepID=A0ABR3UUF6_9PLEO